MTTGLMHGINGNTTIFLMVTYECNLRCRYCLVRKQERWMSWKVAKEAIDVLLRRDTPPEILRIFGGEPLLRFSLVRKTLLYAQETSRRLGLRMLMDVTTNGTRLDEPILAFFRDHPEMELILSLDGTEATQLAGRGGAASSGSYEWVRRYGDRLARLPNVTINKVISPDNVDTLLRDCYFILRLGFTRINLLPSYFNPWEQDRLARLRANLEHLARLIFHLWREGRPISIKNLRVRNEHPLFSDGVLVDPDGTLYSSNMVVCDFFREHRMSARIGSIHDSDTPRSDPRPLLGKLLERALPPHVLESTARADEALTRFVRILSHHGVESGLRAGVGG